MQVFKLIPVTAVSFLLIRNNVCAQNVGIGTSTPTEKLHILGATDADVIVKNEATGTIGSAAFQAKGTGGLYDVFQMTKYNAGTTGSVAGVNLGNLSLLYSGANAGPILLDVITANPMQFATGNQVRMTIDPTGNVGIGTSIPAADLHVLGVSGADVQTKIEAIGAAGSAGIQLKGSAGASDILELTKYNPSAVGTLGGLSVAGLSALNSASTGSFLLNTAGFLLLNSAGGINMNVTTANNITFSTSSTSRAVIDRNGKIIINNGTTTHGLMAIRSTNDSISLYINQNSVPTIFGTQRVEYSGPGDIPRVGVLSTTIKSVADINGTGVEGAGNSIGVWGVGISSVASQVVGLQGESTGSSTYSMGVKGIAGNYLAAPLNNYGVYGYASGGVNNYAVYADGAMRVNGALSKASGTFEIDHPLDPANKYLYHSFVESPDMMNIYNGNIVTDASGTATVTLPDYFSALNKDFRYQLTTIGSFARAMVAKKIDGNSFEIKTSEPDVEVSWQITGVRQDAWANAHRVVPEVEKTGTEKGKYLHPKEFGLPDSMRIGSDINQPASRENLLPVKEK